MTTFVEVQKLNNAVPNAHVILRRMRL